MRALWIWLAVVILAGGLAAQAQELLVFEGSAAGTPITDDEAVGGLRDFGVVAPSTVSTPLTVYFTNNRSTPITFGAYTKSGVNPNAFFINTNSFTNPLPPGQTTFLTVTSYNVTTGDYTATLNVHHDALGSGTSPFEINMAARCANAIVAVTLASPTGQAIVHDDPAAGTGRDFGSWATIAGPTAAVTVFIRNTGTGVLYLSTPDIAGLAWTEFVLDTTGFSATLSAGQSTSFNVAFDPASPGAKYAYVRFAHTATTAPSPFYVPFTGLGLLVLAPVMGLAYGTTAIANGGSLALGNSPAGASTALNFTISNSGNVSLNLTGTPAVQLLNMANCAATLASGPGGTVIPWGYTTNFSIGVTPLGHGAWSFSMWILNDDPARSNFGVTISGLGVVTATELQVVTQPPGVGTMVYLSPAPIVAITDSAGLVRSDDNSTQVLVSIAPGTGAPGAYLSGTLIVKAVGGFVAYPDLQIDRGGDYRLTFTDVTGPFGSVASNSFHISGPGGGGSGSSTDQSCSSSGSSAPGLLWQPLLAAALLALRRFRRRGC